LLMRKRRGDLRVSEVDLEINRELSTVSAYYGDELIASYTIFFSGDRSIVPTIVMGEELWCEMVEREYDRRNK
jgi:hypothetical protein